MIDPAFLFELLVQRALGEVDIDLETLFRRAAAQGMDLDQVESALINDLENEGPIFGKFVSNLIGAAEHTAVAAYRTGGLAIQMATAAEVESDLQRFAMTLDEILNATNTTEVNEHNQRFATVERFFWIAELLNTCPRCLPLHGIAMTMGQWSALGLHPDTIHEGWNSVCHCQFVREDLIKDRKALLTPLVRMNQAAIKGKGILKFRSTVRAVASKDIDKAQKAVLKAKETLNGRRILRLAGMAKDFTMLDADAPGSL